MLRTLLIASLICCSTLSATAQTTDASASRLATQRSPLDWPNPLPDQTPPQLTLDIVTMSKPAIRQRCHNSSVTADSIICRNRRGHPTSTYRIDEIAALIEPPYHSGRNDILFGIAAMSAYLAASFFVPLVPSVILRAMTGFALIGLVSNGIDLSHDHIHDILLYQRPDTPLTVTLR